MDKLKKFAVGFAVFFVIGMIAAVLSFGVGAIVAIVGIKFGPLGVFLLVATGIAAVGGAAFALTAEAKP